MAIIIAKERVLLKEVDVKKVLRVFLVANVCVKKPSVVVVEALPGWGSNRHVGIPLGKFSEGKSSPRNVA